MSERVCVCVSGRVCVSVCVSTCNNINKTAERKNTRIICNPLRTRCNDLSLSLSMCVCAGVCGCVCVPAHGCMPAKACGI